MDQLADKNTISLDAAADLSAEAEQYRAVKLSTGRAAKAALGEHAIGILKNRPKLGAPAEVQIGGQTTWKSGAAFAADAKLMADANGDAITAVAAAGRHVVAIALRAATGAGQRIPVLLVVKPVLA